MAALLVISVAGVGTAAFDPDTTPPEPESGDEIPLPDPETTDTNQSEMDGEFSSPHTAFDPFTWLYPGFFSNIFGGESVPPVTDDPFDGETPPDAIHDDEGANETDSEETDEIEEDDGETDGTEEDNGETDDEGDNLDDAEDSDSEDDSEDTDDDASDSDDSDSTDDTADSDSPEDTDDDTADSNDSEDTDDDTADSDGPEDTDNATDSDDSDSTDDSDETSDSTDDADGDETDTDDSDSEDDSMDDSDGTDDSDSTDTDNTDETALERELVEQYIHEAVNEERTERGLSELEWDEDLSNIAESHSEDMAEREYFSHTSPEGESFADRYEEYGYECRASAGDGTYYTGGENIAMTYYETNVRTDGGETTSYDTERELANGVINQWMNSEGHRENILQEHWNNEGIGVSVTDDDQVYVTQNFC